jgi:hypothetical protein
MTIQTFKQFIDALGLCDPATVLLARKFWKQGRLSAAIDLVEKHSTASLNDVDSLAKPS